MTVYTCCVVGPASTRAKAEVALEQARVPLLPSDHHEMIWASPSRLGLADTDAVLVCQCPDIDAVAGALPEGWALRTHHPAIEAEAVNL